MVFLIVISCAFGSAIIVLLLLAYFRPDLFRAFFRFSLQNHNDYSEIENQSKTGYLSMLPIMNSRNLVNSKNLKDDEALDNLINECDLRAEIRAEEIDIIGDQLEKFSREQHYLNHQDLRQLSISDLSIEESSHKSKEAKGSLFVDDTNMARCDDMLSSLIELMSTSPKYPDGVTLESVQEYMDASETHHKKLLNLATTLIPELHSLLNEQKQEQNDEKKVNHLNGIYSDNESKSTDYRR